MTQIKVGEIKGAHGIKGEVKVASLTDFPKKRFVKGSKLFCEKLGKELVVESAREHKGLYVVKFEGIDDRNTAEEMMFSFLKVDKDNLVKLPKGRYYHFQLVGLKVYEEDKYLGELTQVMETGANDVYVVTNKEAKEKNMQEILLPALPWVILNIDLDNGRMDVKIPAGLLD